VPTYQYACTTCGEQVEAVQKFTDDPLTVCTHCGGSLRKVFSPVGIVFKGSGFYRTDSRKASSATEDAGAKAATANGSGEGSSDGKKKEPAAAGHGDGKKSDPKKTAPAGASSGT
jgi:putative FmdB family regulatory protein